jgi:hypothetical protein
VFGASCARASEIAMAGIVRAGSSRSDSRSSLLERVGGLEEDHGRRVGGGESCSSSGNVRGRSPASDGSRCVHGAYIKKEARSDLSGPGL